jgi:hypothetical protein
MMYGVGTTKGGRKVFVFPWGNLSLAIRRGVIPATIHVFKTQAAARDYGMGLAKESRSLKHARADAAEIRKGNPGAKMIGAPYDFAKAKAVLATGRGGGKTVGHNRRLVVSRHDPEAVGLVLHSTEVVTWYPDGRIRLDSGGWRSVTTKAAMNEALSGWRVYADRRVWKVSFYRHGDPGVEFPVWDFQDGVTLKPPPARHEAKAPPILFDDVVAHDRFLFGNGTWPIREVLAHSPHGLKLAVRINGEHEIVEDAVIRSGDPGHGATWEMYLEPHGNPGSRAAFRVGDILHSRAMGKEYPAGKYRVRVVEVRRLGAGLYNYITKGLRPDIDKDFLIHPLDEMGWEKAAGNPRGKKPLRLVARGPRPKWEAVRYTLKDVGCYVDSARGIHSGEAIQGIAADHGWKGERLDSNSEFYDEAEDEATAYMNDRFPVEGAYWGRNENADWGLWTVEENPRDTTGVNWWRVRHAEPKLFRPGSFRTLVLGPRTQVIRGRLCKTGAWATQSVRVARSFARTMREAQAHARDVLKRGLA